MSCRLTTLQFKTGAELVYNGIVGPNLGRHLLFCSLIPPHNTIRDEFDTSLSMNFGKAIKCTRMMNVYDSHVTENFKKRNKRVTRVRAFESCMYSHVCRITHVHYADSGQVIAFANRNAELAITT